MPSSISSSEGLETRLTAADRPGVAQPVPTRPVPQRPWLLMLGAALLLVLLLTALWEWQSRLHGLLPGDLGDSGSFWAEQRRRIDNEDIPVAIIGDSRILFGTDLTRFEMLTGVRPLQLAVRATTARFLLENLAADPKFKGLAIVGITDLSYFRKRVGVASEGLARYHFESPGQRISFHLYRALSRVLGFLDDDYRVSKLLFRQDHFWRPGVEGQYEDIWKLQVTTDGRQAWLWPRVSQTGLIGDHARYAWHRYAGPKVSPDVIAATIEATRIAVDKIRAHGGDVVFVRPPSSATLRVNEDLRLPRATGWEPLLAAADVKGLHSDDLPAAQGLVFPEFSHLSRACATVFTDAYVRRLVTMTGRMSLRADAPETLAAANCL